VHSYKDPFHDPRLWLRWVKAKKTNVEIGTPDERHSIHDPIWLQGIKGVDEESP
jgi:hypothetical protein